MKIVSLFTGAGGLDLGFIQAGYDIIWSNDNYLPACNTIASNKQYFNAVKYDNPDEKYSNINRIFCGEIEKIKSFKDVVDNEKIDLIIGGFPCQDFSQLRGDEVKGRGGVKVKRGRLYCHFVRALAELKPKMFVAENVKGLISANRGKAYKAIMEDFEHLNDRWGDIKREYGNFNNTHINGKGNGFEGYHIIFNDVVDFSKLGVPQKRERLIIIGIRKDIYKKLKTSKKFSIANFEQNLQDRLLNDGFVDFPISPIEILYGDTLGNLS
jgi:DNA (cytosine-5)-methyltransferase 1